MLTCFYEESDATVDMTDKKYNQNYLLQFLYK